MQSGASTPRAIGRLSRSWRSCSETSGAPSSLFFSRYRSVSGKAAAESTGIVVGRVIAGGTAGRPAMAMPSASAPERSPPAGRAATSAPSAGSGIRPSVERRRPGALDGLASSGAPTPRRRGGRPLRDDRNPTSTWRVHVVVVGCGRVGSGLAVSLTGRGHSVAIIDRNPRAFRRLPADWGGQRVHGSGFDRDHLDEAGAARADALAAVTSGDNSNILTVRIARETYGIAHVVARIYDPRRAEIYQRLGIPTVATVTWTIDQVLRRLLPDDVATEWSDASGRLRLVERELPDSWAGRRLGDLDLPGEISLVAVTRAGIPRLHADDLIGQEGDILHLVVTQDAVGELQRRCGAAGVGGDTGTGGRGPGARP